MTTPDPGTVADTRTAPPRDAAAGSAARRRLVAVLLLVVSLGAIGLVGLGASADRGPGTVFVDGGEMERRDPPQKNEYDEPEWATGEAPTRPPRAEGPNTSLIAALIALGVLLLVVVVWVVLRMRSLARPAPALAGLADEDELTAAQAMAALEDARARLSTEIDAHDAVIAAWLALERAIAEAGVRRDPSQTTLEFVVAVLGYLDLDREALGRLAHLYRRALFDPQPLVESDREQAQGLLDELTAGLAQATDERRAR